MKFSKQNRSCSRRGGRERRADLAMRHGWFRVLLHVEAMLRRPRNLAWHCRHITRQFFYDRDPR